MPDSKLEREPISPDDPNYQNVIFTEIHLLGCVKEAKTALSSSINEVKRDKKILVDAALICGFILNAIGMVAKYPDILEKTCNDLGVSPVGPAIAGAAIGVVSIGVATGSAMRAISGCLRVPYAKHELARAEAEAASVIGHNVALTEEGKTFLEQYDLKQKEGPPSPGRAGMLARFVASMHFEGGHSPL